MRPVSDSASPATLLKITMPSGVPIPQRGFGTRRVQPERGQCPVDAGIAAAIRRKRSPASGVVVAFALPVDTG